MTESFASQFPSPEGYTPVLKQYLEQRAKIGDAILLFRLGDFYESFFADAEVLAKELEITLTARADAAHPGGKVPMAGIPYRTAESCIAKLLKAGLKVAICEQMEEADARGSVKGPMRRELTRILTPGTLTETEYLESESANFLAAIFPGRKSASEETHWGLAFVDISTGQLKVTELSESELAIELAQIRPAELLVPSSRVKDEEGIYIEQLKLPQSFKEANYSITKRPYSLFDLDSALDKIKRQFGEHSLKGFGCAHYEIGLQALGAILEYLEYTYPEAMVGLSAIQVYESNRFLKYDEQTARNLEVFESLRTRTKRGSLIELFEREISTKIGTRLLREWLNFPLISLEQINIRQQAVEKLLELPHFRSNLKDLLSQIVDLERLTVKLQTGRLNPRELGWLKKSLLVLPGLKTLLQEINAVSINSQAETEDLLTLEYSDSLLLKARELDLALLDELPVQSNEGDIFRLGYSEKLDELKTIVEQNESWLADFENQERERTGIRSLKVCFNKAAGFYIELTKANRGTAPANYRIKQNLTNVDRYQTEELKEHEGKFLRAEASLKQTEYELFGFLRESLASYAEELKQIAKRIAQVDCLIAFAELAAKNNYVCPVLDDSLNLEVVNGRHPVVESLLPNGCFVSNDLNLAGGTQRQTLGSTPQIIILTGPNMSGKSTFMKQTALICLMAQIGSFVPADRAQIGLLDRIFTRIGASDDLSLGQSTFMVEMTETAYLLNNMTARSLILLDEIGRGTSTYDGVAIAWAVVEHIAKHGPRTVFATHYHELNGLADLYKSIANYQVSAQEENGELILLHKVMPGGADKSFGIEVARMAGLPKQVLGRAQGIMAQMSSREIPSRRRSLIKESIEQAKLDFGMDFANGSKSLGANT